MSQFRESASTSRSKATTASDNLLAVQTESCPNMGTDIKKLGIVHVAP